MSLENAGIVPVCTDAGKQQNNGAGYDRSICSFTALPWWASASKAYTEAIRSSLIASGIREGAETVL
jgi:hypothetical protein